MASITDLSDNTFDEEVLGSTNPVVVDFWAEWCGPCKMLSPALEEIAAQQVDKIRVVKVNVDDNPEIALRFNAMSIPTLLVFRDGEPVKRLVGARGKGALLEELAEFLS